MVTLRCRYCQRPFQSSRAHARTCSPACRQARARLRRTGTRSEVLAREYGIARGDLWGTPPAVVEDLERFYRFGLDAAATVEDRCAPVHIGPELNALSVRWLDYMPADPEPTDPRPWAIWCNPPYSVKGGGTSPGSGRGSKVPETG